jgi:NADH-quinone oxidoreductase subunit J
MEDYLFYALATALVIFSLLAVSLPNLLHGAISLIGAFFVTAALYIVLQLEFLALAQIMLYIGGIIIFMLIIILLTTGLGVEDRHKVPISRRLAGAGVSVVLLFGLLTAFSGSPSAVLDEDVQRAAPVTISHPGRSCSTSGTGHHG